MNPPAATIANPMALPTNKEKWLRGGTTCSIISTIDEGGIEQFAGVLLAGAPQQMVSYA